MTLIVGQSTTVSAVSLLLKDPVLRAYETCLNTSTGVIAVGADSNSTWDNLTKLYPLWTSTRYASIPALPAPILTAGVYICHDTVTISCDIGAPIIDSVHIGYSIFVHDKDSNMVYTANVESSEGISSFTINRSDLDIDMSSVVCLSVHCKSFGWGHDGDAGHSGPSNSVLVICMPKPNMEFGYINTLDATFGDSITITFDDLVTSDTTETLATRIIISDGATTIERSGTMSSITVPPLPHGTYSYALEVASDDIVVSTRTGELYIPNITVPRLQSFISGTSTASIMTELPVSPYTNDYISKVTLILTSNGITTEQVMPISHSYSIDVTAGSVTSLSIKFDFSIYPDSYVTNSTDISVSPSHAYTYLATPSGSWTAPDEWFEDGNTSVYVDIFAVGCGGDGSMSTSEFNYGTSGGGGACAWVKSALVYKDVAYQYMVGNRDIVSNGITTFADLLTAYPGDSGTAGGTIVSHSVGGTYAINTSSLLYSSKSTHGGGNGGFGGGNGIKAGGGGGAGGPYGSGGAGGTEDIIFYKASNGKGGAGGAPRCGGGGTGIHPGFPGLASGAAGYSGTAGVTFVNELLRPDGGAFGGGGAGANSLFSPGHGGRGTLYIQRSDS